MPTKYSLFELFKIAFPEWEQCDDCDQMYKKRTMTQCQKCHKLLCNHCHRHHEMSVLCDGGEGV